MTETPTQDTYEEEEKAISQAIIRLEKGYVFKNDHTPLAVWETLKDQRNRICDILKYSGWTYKYVDDGDDGYAYLTPLKNNQDGADILRRGSLGVGMSYILVILRKKYQEHYDAGLYGTASIERDELIKILESYSGEITNQEKFRDDVILKLKKLDKMKLIEIKDEKTIVIHSIISSLINAEWLSKFAAHLDELKTTKLGPDMMEDDNESDILEGLEGE